MNLCGIGRELASDAISGAFDGNTSGSGSPVCRSHRRPSWESAAAWNVRASTPLTPSAASRSFSSRAAFSVKVTARIRSAGKVPVAT